MRESLKRLNSDYDVGKMNKSTYSDIRSPTRTDFTSDGYSVSERDLKDLNQSLFNDGSIIGDSGFDDFSDGSVSQKIFVKNIRYAAKSEWKEDKECFVCKRKINKMKGVSSHHCRICGHAACGLCSRKRVNDYRACDICFARLKREEQREESREEFSEHVANRRLATSKETEFRLEAKRNQLDEQILKDKHSFADETYKKEREKKDAEEDLKREQDTAKLLKEKLEKRTLLVSQREDKLSKLKNQVSALKLEVSQKRSMLGNKQRDFEDLKSTRDDLELTKSSLEYHRMKEMTMDIDSEMNSSVMSGRSNSFMVKEKNGRYTLSAKPVKI